MNVNTLNFRAAVTIAAIWVAVFAYLSYSGYHDAYRSADYATFGIPEETSQCQDTVLDLTKQGFQFRERTSEERSDCYSRTMQEHIRLVSSGNQFALEQAWSSFGSTGLLPALLLLAVVAFWTLISTGIGRVGKIYFNWLRFGSTKADSESTDKKP